MAESTAPSSPVLDSDAQAMDTQIKNKEKKVRKYSRATKFKIKKTALMRNSSKREAVTRARVNRILKQQTQRLINGTSENNLYTSGLEKTTRISKDAGEATAQIIEKFLMNILKSAGGAAKHAGRVTVKQCDLDLAVSRV
jgi:histone H3/H4